MFTMRALARFYRNLTELFPVSGDVLVLIKEHAALLGPTATVITAHGGDTRVYEAEFPDALPTVVLPPVTEQDAYTICQIVIDKHAA